MKTDPNKVFQLSILFLVPLMLLHTGVFSQTFKKGDLFTAQNFGIIQWRDSNGVLIKNIVTGENGTGMRHHPITGELWVTNFFTGTNHDRGVHIIKTDGTPGKYVAVYPYQLSPESITFDKKGNAYIGGPNGELVKVSPDGNTILDHYQLPCELTGNGPDWVEIDCSDSIIYYTSERSRIKRYNVATHTQLPDFANLTLPNNSWLFAVRLLSDSTLLVIDANNFVYKLDRNGNIIKTYSPTNPCGFFAMALTPDEKSFWAGGRAFNAPIYKFDIATGNVQNYFTTGPAGDDVSGFAVMGDLARGPCRVSINNPISCENTKPLLTVFPNPGTGLFELKYNISCKSKMSLAVFNYLGQRILTKQVDYDGSNIIPLNLSSCSKGVYLVHLITDRGEFTKKLVLL